LSEQAATVNPSPPAVAIEGAPVDRAPAKPAPVPVSSSLAPVPEQPMVEAMKAAAEQIETYLKSSGRELQFSVDEDTGRTIITVRDSVSGEVIRQIPNDEALRLARSLGNQPNVLVDISI
jgi:flagellar protein FlaG